MAGPRPPPLQTATFRIRKGTNELTCFARLCEVLRCIKGTAAAPILPDIVARSARDGFSMFLVPPAYSSPTLYYGFGGGGFGGGDTDT